MRGWIGYSLGLLAGVAVGGGAAVMTVRNGDFGGESRAGIWSFNNTTGTTDASDFVRAVVAVRGLLALPKEVARYFSATTDSAGRRLDGRCTYRVEGGALPARWWSVTVYDPQGWLIANPAHRHSIGSARVPVTGDGRWAFLVGPATDRAGTVPTGTTGPFDLTLRAYHPRGDMLHNPARVAMPVVTRTECV